MVSDRLEEEGGGDYKAPTVEGWVQFTVRVVFGNVPTPKQRSSSSMDAMRTNPSRDGKNEGCSMCMHHSGMKSGLSLGTGTCRFLLQYIGFTL